MKFGTTIAIAWVLSSISASSAFAEQIVVKGEKAENLVNALQLDYSDVKTTESSGADGLKHLKMNFKFQCTSATSRWKPEECSGDISSMYGEDLQTVIRTLEAAGVPGIHGEQYRFDVRSGECDIALKSSTEADFQCTLNAFVVADDPSDLLNLKYSCSLDRDGVSYKIPVPSVQAPTSETSIEGVGVVKLQIPLPADDQLIIWIAGKQFAADVDDSMPMIRKIEGVGTLRCAPMRRR